VRACQPLGGCEPGEAKITAGFNLPARFVIHTVGPIWRGGESDEALTLASCYRRSLELAEANGCESLAFPAISTGAYGFPHDKAALIAVETLSEFSTTSPVKDIILVALDHRTERHLTNACKHVSARHE